MNWDQALGLGILQGLTEFLPVSSSGHLVLGQTALGLKESQLLFDILLHMGTLVAVLFIYGSDVWRILRAWALSLIGKAEDEEDRISARSGWFLLLGSVPAALVGVLFESFIEAAFGNPRLVAYTLVVTGLLLWFSTRRSSGEREEEEMTWKDAILIGLLQALAIVPGISRSGATIAMALLLGIEREQAARFSFLLSVPAIAGAFVLKTATLPAGTPVYLLPYVIGTVAAAVTGLFALRWLLRIVREGQLRGFAYYCWALAIAAFYLT
ncbi:MAG: undecaprenyl-diphosphate phosphatase, partial [bacterium]|nr:undecaprenyl-diphosphate phosphatase [bacterium]